MGIVPSAARLGATVLAALALVAAQLVAPGAAPPAAAATSPASVRMPQAQVDAMAAALTAAAVPDSVCTIVRLNGVDCPSMGCSGGNWKLLRYLGGANSEQAQLEKLEPGVFAKAAAIVTPPATDTMGYLKQLNGLMDLSLEILRGGQPANTKLCADAKMMSRFLLPQLSRWIDLELKEITRRAASATADNLREIGVSLAFALRFDRWLALTGCPGPGISEIASRVKAPLVKMAKAFARQQTVAGFAAAIQIDRQLSLLAVDDPDLMPYITGQIETYARAKLAALKAKVRACDAAGSNCKDNLAGDVSDPEVAALVRELIDVGRQANLLTGGESPAADKIVTYICNATKCGSKG